MVRHIALSLFCLGLAAPAVAQTAAPPRPQHSINARQAAQAERIQQGQRAGRLTASEVRRLVRIERGIAAAERRLRQSGGALTRAERGLLQRRLNLASRAIFRAAHNRR